MLLLLRSYLGILIKGGPQLWKAPQNNDLVELGIIHAPLLCTSVMQLLCLLASLLHVCWSLLTITLQCDINMRYDVATLSIASYQVLRFTLPHLRYGNSLVFVPLLT